MTRIGASDFRRFQEIIYRSAGIRLSDGKDAMLAARLSKRVRALQLTSYRDYLQQVQRDDHELAQMLDCVTTNETRFFREERQFDFLITSLIPMWAAAAEARRRTRVLRIWSAGCATGEEPYSIAMTLLASLPDAYRWDISIVASDLSSRALRVAQEGVWPLERAAQIPQVWLRRFMLRGEGSQKGKMRAGRELRSMIQFVRLNLNDEQWPLDGVFDLVLCRNVLIYFDRASRSRAVDRLIDRMAGGGYLFVGHAETLHSVTARVQSIVPTIYRKSPEPCTS